MVSNITRQGSLNGDMHELFGRRLMPYYMCKLLYCMHNNLHIFVCHALASYTYLWHVYINQSINQSIKNILQTSSMHGIRIYLFIEYTCTMLYEGRWLNNINIIPSDSNSEGRLNIYRNIKFRPNVEPYVIGRDSGRKRIMAGLRIGCLPLAVEGLVDTHLGRGSAKYVVGVQIVLY